MKTLHSPVIWEQLKNYQIKNLKNDFEIADFEREINLGHVRKIADSIMQHKVLYNNMISVTNTKKPYTVFDGQHRLTALWLCHHEHKLQTCTLMLAKHPKEYGRIIYRRINMGLPLQLKNHLKAMDDGKTPFFTELAPWLSHHPRPDKPEYVSILQAIAYSRGLTRAVSINTVDDVISVIKQKEIDVAIKLCSVTKSYNPQIFGNRLYQAPIYRNAYKAAYVYSLNEQQIQKLIDSMLKDKIIPELAITRNRKDLVRVYEHIKENIIPGIMSK